MRGPIKTVWIIIAGFVSGNIVGSQIFTSNQEESHYEETIKEEPVVLGHRIGPNGHFELVVKK